MFKTILEKVISEYAGEYIKDFSKERLKVGLLNGEVTLTNLELRCEAFAEATEQLPLALIGCRIGKASIKVPWNKLHKESVSVRLTDVSVLLGPHDVTKSGKPGESWDEVLKQQKLKAAEIIRQQFELEGEEIHSDEKSSSAEGKKKSNSFGERLIGRVLDNINISINRIHIQYEDCITNPKSPYSLVLSLETLLLYTTDSNWLPGFIDRRTKKGKTTSSLHRVINLKNLAVHWDRETTGFQLNPEVVSSERQKRMRSRFMVRRSTREVKRLPDAFDRDDRSKTPPPRSSESVTSGNSNQSSTRQMTATPDNNEIDVRSDVDRDVIVLPDLNTDASSTSTSLVSINSDVSSFSTSETSPTSGVSPKRRNRLFKKVKSRLSSSFSKKKKVKGRDLSVSPKYENGTKTENSEEKAQMKHTEDDEPKKSVLLPSDSHMDGDLTNSLNVYEPEKSPPPIADKSTVITVNSESPKKVAVTVKNDDSAQTGRESWWNSLSLVQFSTTASQKEILYVVQPFSIESKLIFSDSDADLVKSNSSDLKRSIFNGLKLELKISCLCFEIDTVKYRDIAVLVERITAHGAFVTQGALQKLRPAFRPDVDPVAWWKYAFNSVKIALKSQMPKGKNAGNKELKSLSNSKYLSNPCWSNTLKLIECRERYILLWKQKHVVSDEHHIKRVKKANESLHTTKSSNAQPDLDDEASQSFETSFVSDIELVELEAVDSYLSMLERGLSINAIMMFRTFAEREYLVERKRLKDLKGSRKSQAIKLGKAMFSFSARKRREKKLRQKRASFSPAGESVPNKDDSFSWELTRKEKQILYSQVFEEIKSTLDWQEHDSNSTDELPTESKSVLGGIFQMINVSVNLEEGTSLKLSDRVKNKTNSKNRLKHETPIQSWTKCDLLCVRLGVLTLSAVVHDNGDFLSEVQLSTMQCADLVSSGSLFPNVLVHRNAADLGSQLLKCSISFTNASDDPGAKQNRDVLCISIAAAPVDVVVNPILVRRMIELVFVSELRSLAPTTLHQLNVLRENAAEDIYKKLAVYPDCVGVSMDKSEQNKSVKRNGDMLKRPTIPFVDVNVTWGAPSVFFPVNVKAETAPVAVLDLGFVKVSSEKAKIGIHDNHSLSGTESLYDSISAHISGVKVSTTSASMASFNTYVKSLRIDSSTTISSKRVSVLEEFNVDITLSRRVCTCSLEEELRLIATNVKHAPESRCGGEDNSALICTNIHVEKLLTNINLETIEIGSQLAEAFLFPSPAFTAKSSKTRRSSDFGSEMYPSPPPFQVKQTLSKILNARARTVSDIHDGDFPWPSAYFGDGLKESIRVLAAEKRRNSSLLEEEIYTDILSCPKRDDLFGIKLVLSLAYFEAKLQLEPSIDEQRNPKKGWNWVWPDTKTVNKSESFPEGLLITKLNSIHSSVEIGKAKTRIRSSVKSMVIEDRLQRAAAGFRYMLHTPVDVERESDLFSLEVFISQDEAVPDTLKSEIPEHKSSRSTKIKINLDVVDIHWNHSTIAALSCFLVKSTQKVSKAIEYVKIRKAQQYSLSSNYSQKQNDFKRHFLEVKKRTSESKEPPVIVTFSLNRLNIILNEETEGRRCALVSVVNAYVHVKDTPRQMRKTPGVQPNRKTGITANIHDLYIWDITSSDVNSVCLVGKNEFALDSMGRLASNEFPLFVGREPKYIGEKRAQLVGKSDTRSDEGMQPLLSLNVSIPGKKKDGTNLRFCDTQVEFTIVNLRFMWAHTYTKEFSEYILTGVAESIFAGFEHSNVSTQMPAYEQNDFIFGNGRKIWTKGERIPVIVQGNIIEPTVIIPITRYGRGYEFDENKTNYIALIAERVTFTLIQFPLPPVDIDGAVVSEYDPYPFPCGDLSLRYKSHPSNETKKNREGSYIPPWPEDKSGFQAKQPPSAEIQMSFLGAQILMIKHGEENDTTNLTINSPIDGRLSWQITDFSPAQWTERERSGCETTLTDRKLREKLRANGGGPGHLFVPVMKKFSIMVDIEPAHVHAGGEDLFLFCLAFIENVNDWRRFHPSLPEPKLPLFSDNKKNGTEMDHVDAADYLAFFVGESKPVGILDVNVRVASVDIVVYDKDGFHTKLNPVPILKACVQGFEITIGEFHKKQQVLEVQVQEVEVLGFNSLTQKFDTVISSIRKSPKPDIFKKQLQTRVRIDDETIYSRDRKTKLQHNWHYEQSSSGVNIIILKYPGKHTRVEVGVDKIDIVPDLPSLLRLPDIIPDLAKVRQQCGLVAFDPNLDIRSALALEVHVSKFQAILPSNWVDFRQAHRNKALLANDVSKSIKTDRWIDVNGRSPSYSMLCIRGSVLVTMAKNRLSAQRLRVESRASAVILKPRKMSESSIYTGNRRKRREGEENERWKEYCILRPFGIQIDQSKEPTDAVGDFHVDAMILLETLKFNFAYEELEILRDISVNLSESVSSVLPNPNQKGRDVLEEPEDIEYNENTSMNVVAETLDFFVLVSNGMEFSFSNDYGSHTIPLVRFFVSNFIVKGEGDFREPEAKRIEKLSLKFEDSKRRVLDEENDISVSALRADYFNQSIMKWEPLLEPWKFSFELQRVLTSETQRISMQILSDQMFNLNLSYAFCEACAFWSACRATRKEGSTGSVAYSNFTNSSNTTPEAQEKKHLSEYFVVNETGVPISFWLGSDNDGRYLLHSGQTLPLNFKLEDASLNQASSMEAYSDCTYHDTFSPNGLGIGRSTLAFANKTNDTNSSRNAAAEKQNGTETKAPKKVRTISFHIDGWKAINNIPIDKYGTFVFDLSRNETKTEIISTENETEALLDTIKVVCSVNLEYGGKVSCRLTSPVKIYNGTLRSLDYLLRPPKYSEKQKSSGSNETDLEPMLIEQVGPGTTIPIPINRLNSDILLRPYVKAFHQNENLSENTNTSKLKARTTAEMLEAKAAGAVAETAEEKGYSFSTLVSLPTVNVAVDRRIVMSCQQADTNKSVPGEKQEYGSKFVSSGIASDFMCYFRVQATSSTNHARLRENYVIEIEAPFQIQNRLPVDLYYRALYSEKSKRNNNNAQEYPVNGGVIEVGNDAEIFSHPIGTKSSSASSAQKVELGEPNLVSSNSSDNLRPNGSSYGEIRFGICVPGSQWSDSWLPNEAFKDDYAYSNEIDISAKADQLLFGPSKHFVYVIDRHGLPLQLVLETSRTSVGSIRVLVYVYAWLINRTNLCMKYRPGGQNVIDELGIRFMEEKMKNSKTSKSSRTLLSEREEGGRDIDELNTRTEQEDENDEIRNTIVESVDRDEVVLFSDTNLLSVSMSMDTASETQSTLESKDLTWSTPISLIAVGAHADINCEIPKRDLPESTEITPSSVPSSAAAKAASAASSAAAATSALASSLMSANKPYFVASMSVSLAPLPFRRSKVVTFVPRFVLVNHIPGVDLIFAPQDNRERLKKHTRGSILSKRSQSLNALEKEGWSLKAATYLENSHTFGVKVESGNAEPFYTVDKSAISSLGTVDPKLCIRITRSNEHKGADSSGISRTSTAWDWSGKFRISAPGEEAIKLHNAQSGMVKVVRIKVADDGPTSLVTVIPESEEHPLYRVINRSSELIHYYQLLDTTSESFFNWNFGFFSESSGSGNVSGDALHDSREYKGVVERLFPKESRVFGWDEPCFGNDRAIVLSFQGDRVLHTVLIDVLDTQAEPETIVIPGMRAKTLRVFSRVEGMTKSLIIMDSVDSIPVSPSLLEKQDSSQLQTKRQQILSPGSLIRKRLGTLLRKNDNGARTRPPLCVQLRLCGAAVSVIDRAPQELILVTLSGINFDYYCIGDDMAKVMSNIHSNIQRNRRNTALSIGNNDNPSKESTPFMIEKGYETFEWSVHRFQVDNQIPGAKFPVLVGPTAKWNAKKAPETTDVLRFRRDTETDINRSRNNSTSADPYNGREEEDCKDGENDNQETYIQISFMKRFGYADDFDFIDYFSILAQELDVKIEDTTLLLLGRFGWECTQRISSELDSVMGLDDEEISSGKADIGTRNSLTNWLEEQNKRSITFRISQNNAEVQEYKESCPDDDSINFENLTDLVLTTSVAAKNAYIQMLHLHPLSINLSFMFTADDPHAILSLNRFRRQPRVVTFSGLYRQNHRLANFHRENEFDADAIVSLLPPALLNIEDAQIRLDELIINHVFANGRQWGVAVGRHYFQQALTQVYKVVGSIDVLGNPAGFFNRIGTGLVDFVFEPAKGMRNGSPGEFAGGVATGTMSLLRNTLFGSFDAVSKITGTLGAGIAYLSFDDEYVSSRRANMRERRPADVGSGFLMGMESLASNIYDGIGGIILHPLQSIEDDTGMEGFMYGVGKGIAGVTVRPVVGVLDLAARTAAGVTSTAESLDTTARIPVSRMRLSRMFYERQRYVRIFSDTDAFISELISKASESKNSASKSPESREYLTHAPADNTLVLIATTQYLACFNYEEYISFQSKWSASEPGPIILWSVPMHYICNIYCSPGSRNIRLVLRTSGVINQNSKAIKSFVSRMNKEDENGTNTAASAYIIETSQNRNSISSQDEKTESNQSNNSSSKAELVVPVDSTQRGAFCVQRFLPFIRRNLKPVAQASNKRKLGISLQSINGNIIIRKVLENSLADVAGIKEGSQLMSVILETNMVDPTRGFTSVTAAKNALRCAIDDVNRKKALGKTGLTLDLVVKDSPASSNYLFRSISV